MILINLNFRHLTTGKKAEPQPRLRNQSSCSSDCSFIEFDREEVDHRDEMEDEDEEDDDEDSEFDDDFDDSDWDDDLDDSATGRCVVVDLADFADLVGVDCSVNQFCILCECLFIISSLCF